MKHPFLNFIAVVALFAVSAICHKAAAQDSLSTDHSTSADSADSAAAGTTAVDQSVEAKAMEASHHAAEASHRAAEASRQATEASKRATEALEKVRSLESRPVEAPVDDRYGYDGGFYFGDREGLFQLKVNARMQARYTFESIEEIDSNDERVREQEQHFSIPAARLKLKGHVFSRKVTYAFQTDFGKGNALLKDFYTDVAFVKGKFHIRAGQWVKPWSRQQITSSGKLEFAGRAITDKAFGAGRDIGLAFHNNYEKSPVFEWALGVFNGTGEKPWFVGKLSFDEETGHADGVSGKFTNVPDVFNPIVAMRLGLNTGGLKGYSEADLEGGSARFGVAVSGIADMDVDDDDDGNWRAQLDYMLKAGGFSSTGGIYAATRQDGGSFGDQEFGALGFHVQTGYLIKGRVQPTFRYAFLNPEGADNYVQELLGGISLFVFKHNLKWQTEAGAFINQEGSSMLSDAVVRSQLQLAF